MQNYIPSGKTIVIFATLVVVGYTVGTRELMQM